MHQSNLDRQSLHSYDSIYNLSTQHVQGTFINEPPLHSLVSFTHLRVKVF